MSPPARQDLAEQATLLLRADDSFFLVHTYFTFIRSILDAYHAHPRGKRAKRVSRGWMGVSSDKKHKTQPALCGPTRLPSANRGLNGS